MPLETFQQAILHACIHQEGCALCRAIWKIDGARFSWYINDDVLDKETIRHVVHAQGFCSLHALYLSMLEGQDFLWSHLGSCMLYHDVISNTLLPDLQGMLRSSRLWLPYPFKRRLLAPYRHLSHQEGCPLCFDHHQHANLYLQAFIRSFQASSAFRSAYLQADSLCLPHFLLLKDSLADPHMIRLLEDAERQALNHFVHIPSLFAQSQLQHLLAMLYGGDAILWSVLRSRATLPYSQANPLSCAACQQENGDISGNNLAFFASIKAAQPNALFLCAWHTCWLYDVVERQPELIPHLLPLLHHTCQHLLDQLDNCTSEPGQQTCDLCRWFEEQDTLLLMDLQPELADPEQRLKLCLPHGRVLLQKTQDDKTARSAVVALYRGVRPVTNWLQGYIQKCTERLQNQMLLEEQGVWFDALHWFGGNQIAGYLLSEE
jgi:hypothetical protein